MTHTDNDEAVVARVLAGETAAFSILAERHGQRLFHKCLSVVRDHDVAEDCVQKTFVLALERLAQFRREAQFSTWLISISVNVALSHLRQRAGRMAAEVPLETDLPGSPVILLPDPGEDPETACVRSESRKHLQGAMRSLKRSYRVVVILRDLEERSTRETANILGISEPAVKTRLLRARNRLKDALSSWWSAQRPKASLHRSKGRETTILVQDLHLREAGLL